MKLNRNILFPTLLIIQIVINLLFVINSNYLFIRTILSFLSLVLMPGLLLILCLRIKNLRNYEYLSYIIGFSLSLLILGGLLINSLLPLIGVIKPLSDIPVIVGYNLLLLILGVITFFRSKDLNLSISYPKFSKLNWFILLSSLVFLPLSIFGAVTLNNGGTNGVALSMIVGIVIYIFTVTLFRKHLVDDIFPPIIYFIGLALLLSYSLRSWHILGWDINLEYQMFQLTKTRLLWTVSNSLDPFNSCLSITILPTLFNTFLKINDEYIFKLVYQLLFAIVPINIFLIVRRYTSSLVAFFSSFLLMSQEFFYMGLTSVTRQEIALIFFTCSVLVLLNNKIEAKIRNVIFILFGASLVVAHYSTTYSALFLFFTAYFLILILRYINGKSQFINNLIIGNQRLKNVNLKLIPLLILLVLTIIWNVFITKSANNLKYTISGMYRSIGETFTNNNRSQTVYSFLFNKNYSYSSDQLDESIKKFSGQYLRLNKIDPVLKGEIVDIYKPHLVSYKPLLQEKNLLTSISSYPYTIAKYIIMLSLFIGIIYLLMNKTNNNIYYDVEYLFLAIASLIFIILVVILPHISVAYNVERVFFQSLTFSSFFILIGMEIIFKSFRSLKYFLILSVLVIYMLYQSGVTAPFTGNVLRVNTSNTGMEYDEHYIHEEDISAIKWISNRYDNYMYIYMDFMAIPKFKAFAGRNINKIQYVIPNIIDKSNYVYASYSNTHGNIAFIDDIIYSSGNTLAISYPFNFLNTNKNLVYNNGGAKIYK